MQIGSDSTYKCVETHAFTTLDLTSTFHINEKN